ncbi:ACP phosphodiesterase [Veronia nyctiphanis]|uniref:ACP phosphodiesterase n=2 Tax=Veronia nyctiphanis TaxID=1278244 RepID=A0A4Q0YQ15_9GAMM|nr:ACP phosphodiesterase [Veronia nyctiphanis]
MNYLAHLHIAQLCESELTGNLAADFIRGKPEGKFPEKTVNAIYLHRFVDRFIDNLPETKYCRQHFSKDLYRFSAIALDIFWDHILAIDWDNYHSLDLEQFVENCRVRCNEEKQHIPQLPTSYLTTAERMWQNDWLLSYRKRETIALVLERMSHRSPRMAPLRDCAAEINVHYELFHEQFSGIYKQVQHAALAFNETRT